MENCGGEQSVGKTSLLKRYIFRSFDENTECTLSGLFINTKRVSFQTKSLKVGAQKVNLSIWDTAGQEKYRSLAPLYYRGADAAIIVFDYTSKSSFEVLKYWLNQVEKYTKETKLVIVGNKIDLKDKREVTEDDIEQLITEYPGAILYKTSAKANILVEEVFNNTASLLTMNVFHASEEKETQIGDHIFDDPPLVNINKVRTSSCC